MPSQSKNFGSAAAGAAKGAAAGAAVGGVPGAVIGGIYGGVQGYFGSDADEQAQQANQQLYAEKQKELGQVTDWKEKLRQEAVGGADIAAGRSEQNYQDLVKAQGQVAGAFGGMANAAERAGQVATTGARQQAAAALRAAAGTGGSGGAKAAQLGTVGAGLGQQVGQTLADAAKQKAAVELQGAQTAYGLTGQTGQAGVEAGAQKIEAAKTKKEAGTAGTDYQQKLRDYQGQIAKIKQSKKGGLGGMLPDDEEGAANEIEQLAAAEEDPKLKDWLNKQAAAAREDI
jgi:hypothetical protein